MAGFWMQLIVPALAASFGVAAVVWLTRHPSVRARGGGSEGSVVGNATGRSACDAERRATAHRDPWTSALNRCEQAVCRAARVADTVSSEHVRRVLRCVVHRMDAELPHVRALVELGWRLDADAQRDGQAQGYGQVQGHGPGAGLVVTRVHQHLAEGANGFSAVADDVERSVSELVADADLERARKRAGLLRERFPLLPPMSSVLGSPATPDATEQPHPVALPAGRPGDRAS